MQSRRKLIFDKIKKSISIVNIGVVSAIILPIAYLLGSSYHQGYLSVYGIETTVFPLSTQDVYIYSYNAVSLFLLKIWKYILTILKFPEKLWLISAVFVLISSVYITLQYPLIRRGILKIKNPLASSSWEENNFTKSIWITFISFESAFFIIIILLITPSLWFAPQLIGYSEGKEFALSIRKLFKNNGCSTDKKTGLDICSVIQDKDGKILHEGLLIAINDKDIAMFKKDGSYIFTRQNDWLIRRKLH
ncbi:hypothetical protein GMJAKD_12925 [Candidatus Electrothrix aarhusensis]